MKTILSKFQQLPLTNIENEEIRYRLENKKISAILVDILDGDLWGSRVSVIGNFLIIIAILFSSADFIFNFSQFSRSNLIINFKWLVGLFFLLEVALRISYAGFLGYGIGFAARLKYIFSFMGLVDILSLIPVVLELLGIPVSGGISAIRILRIWRIAQIGRAHV